MYFFSSASWNTQFKFICSGFPPASFPYKPLVLLFSPNELYEGLEKNTKKWAKNIRRSRKWYDNSGVRTIAPKENCFLDNCSFPRELPHGWLLRENYSKSSCPLTLSSWKLHPSAFRMICCLHNCPKENFPPGILFQG